MAKATEQLAEVNIAITKILSGGQSYQIGSRRMTRADIGVLYQMKKELESAVNSDEGSGGLGRGVAVSVFDGR